MDPGLTILIVAIGALFVGAAFGWVIHSHRSQRLMADKETSARAEIAVLNERLHNNQQQMSELQQQLESERATNSAYTQRHVDMTRSLATVQGEAQRAGEMLEQLKIKEQQTTDLSNKLQTAAVQIAELQTALTNERNGAHEKIRLLNQAQDDLCATFKALSSDALRLNNQTFMDLAAATLAKYQTEASTSIDAKTKSIDELVKPLKEALSSVDSKINQIEKSRIESFAALGEQIQILANCHQGLQKETGNLVQALRTPTVRGRWGEIQLQRVVEMAGMLEHCDFYQQISADSQFGENEDCVRSRVRPDLLVKLPGSRNIVVDAKAPLQAYLESLESSDDATRAQLLQDHARQVRAHLAKLSAKNYWDQFQPAPEFVVLFLPGETFFSAALQHDPTLIEAGVEQKVLIATPTTLIALLRAVAYGWQQEKLSQNAQMISDLGRTLYDRIRTMSQHFSRLRNSLAGTVDSYNKVIGSLETRVLPAARRFQELGASTSETIEPLDALDQPLRPIHVSSTIDVDTLNPEVLDSHLRPTSRGADMSLDCNQSSGGL